MLTNRLALVLLAACAIAAFIGPIFEARHRAPEAALRAYLDAVEREDLVAAEGAIAPGERNAVHDRIAAQLGTEYRVDVLALGGPSLLARLMGTPGTSAQATILAQVSPRAAPPWSSSAVVQMVELEGSWYVVNPPFI